MRIELRLTRHGWCDPEHPLAPLRVGTTDEEPIMDREHVKGAADKVKGAVKDTAGKVTVTRRCRPPRDRPQPPRKNIFT